MKGLALYLGCHGSSLLVTGDRNPEAWQLRHAVSEVSCHRDGFLAEYTLIQVTALSPVC